MSDLVLLVTHSGDFFNVDRVSESLVRRGARPLRVDTDLYPSELSLSFAVDGESRHRYSHGDIAFDVADVRAAWIRKVAPPKLDPDLDERFAAGAAAQAITAMSGFIAALETGYVIDRRDAVTAAENKIHQLALARRAGLQLPPTLVTNNAEEARRFITERAATVTKLLRPLSTAMGRAPLTMFTSAVSDDDLEALDSLALAPMIFQERVDKQVELRAMYVGGTFFTAAIDASGTARGTVDWRRADVGEATWQPAELPAATAAAGDALMRMLGLQLGAFDFIRTPGGEHVFLEVNPAGEWGMLERNLGLPIADAIAGLLWSPR